MRVSASFPGFSKQKTRNKQTNKNQPFITWSVVAGRSRIDGRRDPWASQQGWLDLWARCTGRETRKGGEGGGKGGGGEEEEQRERRKGRKRRLKNKTKQKLIKQNP